mgnify:CR=1 FL=1
MNTFLILFFSFSFYVISNLLSYELGKKRGRLHGLLSHYRYRLKNCNPVQEFQPFQSVPDSSELEREITKVLSELETKWV